VVAVVLVGIIVVVVYVVIVVAVVGSGVVVIAVTVLSCVGQSRTYCVTTMCRLVSKSSQNWL